MTPHRDQGAGTFLLDIRLGKLGRMKRASGTDDPQLFAEVSTMFRMLRRRRQWDVLALVVNGHLSPLDLYDLFTAGRLDAAPTAEHLRNLRVTVERWIASLDRSETTRRQYAWLLSHVGDAHTTLAQVPRLLEVARVTALREGKRPRFNNSLSAVRQMLKWAVGDDHVLMRDALRVELLRVTHRAGNPQEPEVLRDLALKLGSYGPMVWALALTGMRRGEYFRRRYELRPDRLLIHGTKTRAAERAVFLAYPIAAPTCSYDHFRDLLTTVTEGLVRVHDFRYTFVRWCEDAGIPVRRVRWYAGHAIADAGELYGRGRLFAEHVRSDAERFRAFLGDGPAHTLAVAR